MPLYIERSLHPNMLENCLVLPSSFSSFIYIDHPLFLYFHSFCFVLFFWKIFFFNSFSLSSSIRLSLLFIVSTYACVHLSAQTTYLFSFFYHQVSQSVRKQSWKDKYKMEMFTEQEGRLCVYRTSIVIVCFGIFFPLFRLELLVFCL